MYTEMPRLDKTRINVSFLGEFAEDKQYWLSLGKAERLNAIEINRRMVYGTDRATSRLQRVLETAELTRRYYSGNNICQSCHSGESRNPEFIRLDAGSGPA